VFFFFFFFDMIHIGLCFNLHLNFVGFTKDLQGNELH